MLTLHRGFLAVVFLAGLAATAPAQVVLEQKFVEGSSFRSDVEVTAEQTLSIAGMDLETASTSFMEVSSDVGQRKGDGSLEIKGRVTSLQTEAEFPGGIKVAFDSGNPSKPADVAELEMVMDLYRAILEITTTHVVDKDNRTQSVTASPEVVQKINELFRDQFYPAALKREAVQNEERIPREPIDVGEVWERSEVFNASGGSTLVFRHTYEYKGTVDRDGKKLDRIVATTKSVTLEQQANPAVPLQVTASDLKVDSSDAELLFDRELGIVTSSNSSIHVSGSLKLTIMGQNLDGTLDLKLNQKSALKP